MRNYHPGFLAGLVLLALLAAPPVQAQSRLDFSFKSADERVSRSFGGVLRLPRSAASLVPAVIMLHAVEGPDRRYGYHGGALLDDGIAVLELDFKRGGYVRDNQAPPPKVLVRHVFGALRAMRRQGRVDPLRIGLLGFAAGAEVVLLASQETVRRNWLRGGEAGFAVSVALYPDCSQRGSGRAQGQGPLLILIGARDFNGGGRRCPRWAGSRSGLAQVQVFPGIHHGFDKRGEQRFSSRERTLAGKIAWKFDAATASAARRRANAHFRAVLRPQSR
ncbi:MAG TPA: dienelactone hydrolase family protein [Alphaproteobacteria bacterium]|jgi:dienelactone hydrolase|nr:dienelactone hydrolase family protein [Alphaproteobacteria bacterium]